MLLSRRASAQKSTASFRLWSLVLQFSKANAFKVSAWSFVRTTISESGQTPVVVWVQRRFARNVKKVTMFAALGLVFRRSPFTARTPSALRLRFIKVRMNDSKLFPLAVTQLWRARLASAVFTDW